MKTFSPFYLPIPNWKTICPRLLQGQIASAKIPLSRMISPQLYWVMSASEFTLDINNPKEPKILCVGNNPDRQNIYGAALGLYNSRIVKLINKKGKLKSSVIIDEFFDERSGKAERPTIYFKGLDNLIAPHEVTRLPCASVFRTSASWYVTMVTKRQKSYRIR